MRFLDCKLPKEEFVKQLKEFYLENGMTESSQFPGRFCEIDKKIGHLITSRSLDDSYRIMQNYSHLDDDKYNEYLLACIEVMVRIDSLNPDGSKKEGEYITVPYTEFVATKDFDLVEGEDQLRESVDEL